MIHACATCAHEVGGNAWEAFAKDKFFDEVAFCPKVADLNKGFFVGGALGHGLGVCVEFVYFFGEFLAIMRQNLRG